MEVMSLISWTLAPPGGHRLAYKRKQEKIVLAEFRKRKCLLK